MIAKQDIVVMKKQRMKSDLSAANTRHFSLEVDGVPFVYTYIRKNACSAWKRLFALESPHAALAPGFDSTLRFMSAYHRVRSFGEIARCPNRIVVLRDPVERTVSSFINQYVMRLTRGSSIHVKWRAFTGKPVEPVSFRRFVEDYVLQQDPRLVDGHFMSQHLHMTGMEYNQLWPMRRLSDCAESLFGARVAAAYFRKKTHSTDSVPRYLTPSIDTTALELHARWRQSGGIPDVKAMLDEQLTARLREYYRGDIDLHEQAERISPRP